MGRSPKRLLQVLVACLAVGLILLFFSFITHPKNTNSRNPITQKPYTRATTVSQNLATGLSCPDYESIFGPSYNSQLFVDWAVWSRLNTTSNASTNQAAINYQYNTAAQQSYGLYTASMQARGCTPAISPPTALSPASPPSSTFDPFSLGPNQNCNVPLAYQLLLLYNNQFYLMQQQSQTSLENWLKSQSISTDGVSSVLQQGAVAIQAQFYAQAKALSLQYSSAVGQAGCSV